ncbi:MAG: InlB B-repeat-containing protein [Chitinispirillales bacterium]|nr:InlB B-repeat-containing protein [Chitinispirillales bacterium]
MKNTLLAVTLFTVFVAVNVFAQQSGKTTRYWDSCKPSCAWTANAPVTQANPHGAAISCDASGGKLSNANARNACESGGTSYTCMDQAPWAVNENLSYGFAASHTNGDCGKCFELTFTNSPHGGTSITGKKMVVMISNIGGDVGATQFDIMIPGGGVGIFNALSSQISSNGGPGNPSLGQQYGGFRATCGNNATCIRNMCAAAFNTPALAHLKAGCDWYVDWFNIADNPNVTYTQVNCPQALVDKYKGNAITNPTEYTLTINRNPSTIGSTNPSGTSQRAAGSSVTVTATVPSGYTFSGWTATTGTIPSGVNTSSAQISFAMPGSNLTLVANYTQTPQNYTLTVNRNPSNIGSTNPTGASQRAAGSSVTVTAAVPVGYTFTGWTATTGTIPTGVNTSNASITFNMPSSNLTLVANYEVQTYTLTVNRNPTAGGTVSNTPSGTSFSAGTSVTVTATANSGYTFSDWTGAPQGAAASGNSITFVMNSNVTLTANFNQTQAQTYTLTVNRNNNAYGTTDPTGTSQRNANASVTVTAIANSGYTFTNWTTTTGTLPSGVNASDASITFDMPGSNLTLVANFEQQQTQTYTLTVNRNNNDYGTTDPAGASQRSANAPVTVTAAPNSGYEFTNWTATVGTLPSGVNASDASITFNMPGSNLTLVANFRQQSIGGCDQSLPENQRLLLTISIEPAGSGTVLKDPEKSCYHTSEPFSLTAVPNQGYVFDRWQGDDLHGSQLTASSNMWWHRSVTAHFSQSTVSVAQETVKTETRTRSKTAVRIGSAGFNAVLADGHSYYSYILVDLQGREILRGSIKAGAKELQFNNKNIRNRVLFLKLKGKNTTTVLKAAAF